MRNNEFKVPENYGALSFPLSFGAHYPNASFLPNTHFSWSSSSYINSTGYIVVETIINMSSYYNRSVKLHSTVTFSSHLHPNPSGSTSSTAPGWFSNQRVHTVTMPWTIVCLSPVGDAMCASSTFTGLRRTHTFVRGPMSNATSAFSASQRASSQYTGSHVRGSFAVLAKCQESKT